MRYRRLERDLRRQCCGAVTTRLRSISLFPALIVAIAGCGTLNRSGTASSSTAVTAHPQAIEPSVGDPPPIAVEPSTPVGDVTAHAPSLAEVKRELKIMNLCGGAPTEGSIAWGRAVTAVDEL